MDLVTRAKRRTTTQTKEAYSPHAPSPVSLSSISHRGLDVRSITQPRVRSHSPSKPQVSRVNVTDPFDNGSHAGAQIRSHRSGRPPRCGLARRTLSFIWLLLDFRSRRGRVALTLLFAVALLVAYLAFSYSDPEDWYTRETEHDDPVAIERSAFAGIWNVQYSDGDSNRYTIDFDGNVDSASGDGGKSGRLVYLSATVFRLSGIYREPAFEELRIVEQDDAGAIVELELTHFYRPMEECCTAVAKRIGLLHDIDSEKWAYVLLSSSKVGAKDVTATVILRPPISVRNKPEIVVTMEGFRGDAKLDAHGGPSDNHLDRNANFKSNTKFGEAITISRAIRELDADKEYSFTLRGVENPIISGEARIFIECGVLLANITIPIVEAVPGRLVTVADLHGDIAKARRVLKWQGLINDDDHWIGGPATLVQTGDLIDRGPFSLEVLQLFHKLRREAPDQGGHVELLLGNHEVMWLQNSWQYLHPDDKLRLQSLPDRIPKLVAGRQRSSDSVTNSEAAEWMLTCGITYARNDTVFVHGGISPEWAEKGIDGINEQFHRALMSDPVNSILSDSGPLWTRKFSTGDLHCEELRESLRLLGLKRMVVGHSIQFAGVPSTYCNGLVYAIDIAMSDYMTLQYTPDPSKMAVFEILDGEPRIAVFKDDEDGNSKLDGGNGNGVISRRRRRKQ